MITLDSQKVKNIILVFLILGFSVFLIFAIYNKIRWHYDNKNTIEQLNTINTKIKIVDVTDSEKTTVIAPSEVVEETNPYWDYIKINMIDVDFTELKEINSDVVGWIKVEGTNINYPFVQTTDNDYYLNHSFDKSFNTAGWVFMDYRNSQDTLNKNMILYAHGRLNDTMFGSLRNYETNGWLNDENNYIIKMSLENYNYLWQVFSIYKIPTTNDYIRTIFNDSQDYQEFLDMIKSRSSYDFNTTVSYEDNILTLSTCYDSSTKVVLHAKLIKMTTK